MLEKIANNSNVCSLFCSHAKDFLEMLKVENLHFSVVCDTELIEFDPPLTQELQNKLGKMSVFILSGYSFETLKISKDFFSFEAGLIVEEGNDFATLLKIPYVGVVQILAQGEDTSIPLFINPFEAKKIKECKDSKQAILAKNQILLKRKK